VESDSSSSSESDSDSEPESESEYKPSSPSNGSRTVEDSDEDETVYTECSSSESEEEEETKLRKTIAKIFPSKYSKERAKTKDIKHRTKRDECESDESESDVETKKSVKKRNKKTKQDKKQKHSKRKIESSDEEYDTAEDEEEGRFLILSVGGANDDEYDEYSEVESLSEDTAEEFDSDDEKKFMGEAYATSATCEVKDETAKNQKSPKSSKKDSKKSKDKSKEKEKEKEKDKAKNTVDKDLNPIPDNVESEYKEMLDVRKMLMEQMQRRPKNKFLISSLNECNDNIKKLARKARHENTNAYYKLVNSDKRQTDEIDYFKHRLSNKEQQGIMTDLKEINRTIYSEKPYRLSILQSNIPSKFKTVAMQRLNTLKSMDPGDHEYYKIKNWVDAFMRIPFGVYRNISVRMTDGIDVCDEFMNSAKKTLDDCVYGLNDAKLQIMQMLGQWIVNPDSVGTSIAIHGPPGTGKTSIVKDGISKILGREFAFIALGGCGDGSFLEGHSYTYEGSTWGRIVQILMECKSMNPIIYFDELDKVSDTPRGQEIIGILTHLTDTSQNEEFHDKYFSEVSLDLSKCLFIFSYNDENAVNPILKDRMYRIQTKGYESKEKITIARDYLLPKIREQVSFKPEEIVIPDETLQYIISTSHLTKGEAGVRNLKRCLEIIYTKLNLYRLVKPGNSMFEKDLGVKVEFPMTVNRKELDVFIKNNETLNPSILAMYC
jgi:ATP-dependent Lon protease